MPLGPNNTRYIHQTLFAGQCQTVTLLKRGNDQKQGTVASYPLFDARRGQITKTGETVENDQASEHMCTWHIPLEQIQRLGFQYLNAIDRIVDEDGYWWQPEGTTDITEKLWRNELDLNCLRIDPPVQQA